MPKSDETFMRRAIALAKLAEGDTHPNPLVGAVIVEEGRIVAEGWHTRAGEPHAEPAALRALGRKPAPGATLYVTLEPCCTQGRTPPCTETIKSAGIRRVVIGATDPNPAHRGRGHAALRAAGIEIVPDVLADDCADLNLIFNHRMSSGGSPLFAMKTAATLDGRVATSAGESRWITGESARAEVMRLRRYFPAIAAGAGTVLEDDPSLTARIPDGVRCPLRLVLDRSGRLFGKADRKIFSDEFRDRTIIVLGERAHDESPLWFEDRGATVWVLPDAGDADFLQHLRHRCEQEGVGGVLIEAGGSLGGALLGHRQADYLYHFSAPMLFADPHAKSLAEGPARPRLADAIRLRDIRRESFGDDLLTRGRIVYPA